MAWGEDRLHRGGAEADPLAVGDGFDAGGVNARDAELERVAADDGAGERGGLVESGDVVVLALPGHEDQPQAVACDRELVSVGGRWVVQARPLD